MKTDFVGIRDLFEFNNHKFVTCFSDEKNGLYGFIAIHRGSQKIPAFGATRITNYPDTRSAVVDALRLSKTMSRKAALAGLHCGGAKAVIISNKGISNRKNLLKSYADKVNVLGGHFITGADVGISREDVGIMRRYSHYIVGVKVDPVRYTGLGILLSLRVCLKDVFGSSKIKGKSFAIQGVGKIGADLLSRIYPFAKEICIADIDTKRVNFIKSKYPKVKVVSTDEIDKMKVDVFSPCALSNCINQNNIDKLKSSIVCGGANCQLESSNLGVKLYEKGILYAPDYLVNAGGLISVYDEYEYGNTRVKRVKRRVRKIKNTMQKILESSRKEKRPPFLVADKLAETIYEKIC